MNQFREILYVAILASDILLIVSSRLLHCIKFVAFQGVILSLIGLLLAIANGNIILVDCGIALVTLLLKAVVIPGLLARTMRSVNIKRELEPLLGYSLSCLAAIAIIGCSYLVCRRIGFAEASNYAFFTTVSFSTMLMGLFLIIARRNAIMQVIGFLVFENGITLFGSAMNVEYELAVELGILLDVLVLVFIMGIAVFHIKREYHHIDSDQLNHLGDNSNAGRDPFADEEEGE